MKSWHRYIVCAGVMLAAAALSTPAAAQKVHRYGGIGEDPDTATSVTTVQPAAVRSAMGQAPQAEDAQTGEAQADAESSDEDSGGEEGELQPSHELKMAGSPGINVGPRTTLDLAVDQLYRGIIPGTRDEVQHLSKARESGADAARANELTWLGFHPTDDHTRVFLQTARKVQYHVRRKQDPAIIEITLDNTKIPAKNFTRYIDTSYFGRNVKSVEAAKLDASTVRVSIKLDSFEQPTVRESDNYIYFDFAAQADERQDDGSHASSQAP